MSLIDKIVVMENVLIRLIKNTYHFDHCTNQKGEFWALAQNALGEHVCMSWCHLFGNDKDDHHFKNVFDIEAVELAGPQFSVDGVRIRLLKHLGMTAPEYKTFWDQVHKCRNQFIAHKQAGATVVFPEIDNCRKQAEELRRILADFINAADRKDPESIWEGLQGYYEGQYLGDEQFSPECKSDFANSITYAAGSLLAETD